MKLHIDTTQIRSATVIMGEFNKTSQSLVPLIEEAVQANNCTFSDITEIRVATGPGSFTGLRVGAAVANALGFLLGIPVNGKKALVTPLY